MTAPPSSAHLHHKHSARDTSLKNKTQRGNVFFTLFGAVAVLGVLGAGIMATMRGPLTTMVEVKRRTQAESEMDIASKLIMLESVKDPSTAGDCDTDGFVEPIEFKTTTGDRPTNGGILPNVISSQKEDPWGTDYGYCVWDAGTDVDQSDCSGENRLAGKGDGSTDYTVIAIISAGTDKNFTTTCNAGASAGVTRSGDDIVKSYTYATAVAASDGLWKLKIGEPGVAEIDKDIEAQGAKFSGDVDLSTSASSQLKLGAASMLLPRKSAEYSGSATCTAGDINLLRINDDAPASPLVEICNGTNWVSASSIWTKKSDDELFYTDGNVGIGTNDPQYPLDVDGTIFTTGQLRLGHQYHFITRSGTSNVFHSSGFHNFSGTAGLIMRMKVSNKVTDFYGNVGILDTTPDAKLEVVGDLFVSSNNAGDGDRFTVTNSGNVGIGDPSPDDALDVAGDIDATGTYMLDDAPMLSNNDTASSILLGNVNAPSGATEYMNLGDAIHADLTSANKRVGIGFADSYNVSLFNDTLEVNGTFDATGDGNFGGDLDVAGALDVTGDIDGNDLTIANITATGDADVDGTMEADDYTWGGTTLTPVVCGSNEYSAWESGGWVCRADTAGGSGGGGAQNLDDVLDAGDDGGGNDITNINDIEAVQYCDENGANCFTAAAAAEATSLWQKNGSNVYYSSGNVGIGITNPTVPLYVAGTSVLDRLIVEYTGASNIPRIRSVQAGRAVEIGDSGVQIGASGGDIVKRANTNGIFTFINGATSDGRGFQFYSGDGTGHPNLPRFYIGSSNTSAGADAPVHFTNILGVGVNTTTPSSGTGGQLKLDVEGNIGAIQYCDEDGDNCFTPTDVTNASAPGSDRQIIINDNGAFGASDIVITAGSSAGAGGDITTGLVAHYAFDDGSGAIATDSAGSNDGTLTGGPTWVAGKVGSGALDFDGSNDFIDLGDLGLSSWPITVSVWVQPDTVSSAISAVGFADSGEANQQFAVASIKASGEWSLWNFDGSYTESLGSSANIDTWYHVTVVYENDTTKKLYINGVLDIDWTDNEPIPTGINRVNIGRLADSTPGGYFDGTIDDVRIYSRALSATDAQTLYESADNPETRNVAMGIGDTTPDGDLRLDVAGNIGAEGYCDEDGDNCFTATDVADASNIWTQSGSDIFYNSGNVGIGTDDPVSQLHLGTTGYRDPSATGSSGDFSIIPNLVNVVADHGWMTGNRYFIQAKHKTNAGQYFPILLNPLAGSGGRVGVGLDSPAAGLHVRSVGTPVTIIERSGAANASIHFKTSTGDIYVGQSNSGHFAIDNDIDMTSDTLFKIFNSGEVLIGTDNPSSGLKLDVEGPVGATQYCDEDGDNCFAATDVAAAATAPGSDRQIIINDDGEYGASDVVITGGGGGGGAPAFQTVETSSASVGSGSFTLNMPSGVQEDDVLIAIIGTSGTNAITPAGGWTQIDADTFQETLSAYYKVAGAAEPASYSFTVSGGGRLMYSVMRYSNVNTASPINGYQTATGNSATGNTPSYTTTSDNTMVVRAIIANENDNNQPIQSTPATERFRANDPNNYGMGVSDAVQASAGATGVETYAFQYGDSSGFVGMTIALNGASGGGDSAIVIGDTSADGDLRLDVAGNIGAEGYCDEDGNNCFTATDVADASNIWTQSGSDIFYNSGNVGVGTDDPATDFEISNSSGSVLRLSRNDTSADLNDVYGAIEFYSNDDNDGDEVRSKIVGRASVSGGRRSAIDFYNSTNGNMTNFMTLNHHGWLGLNTGGDLGVDLPAYTTPGFSTNDRFLIIRPKYYSNSGVLLAAESGNASQGMLLRHKANSPSNDASYLDVFGNNSFYIRTQTATTPIDAFTVQGDGKIGIATTTVSTGGEQDLALDVDGPVGATNYCDEDGNNCFTAVDIASGASGLWTASAGDSIYYNSGTPKVGIGTDSPGAALDISRTDGLDHLVLTNPTSTTGKKYAFASENDGRFSLIDRTDSRRRMSLLTSGNTMFYGADGSSVTMSLLSNGNVGIGKADPNVPLEVVGAGRFSGVLESKDLTITPVTDSQTASALVNLKSWGNNGWWRMASNYNSGTRDFFIQSANTSWKPLNFRNSTNEITLDGNVGINTTTPSSGTGGQLALDVEGPMGATNYCDEDGNNCFTAVDIASGATGLWIASAGDSIYFNSGTPLVGIGTDSPTATLTVETNLTNDGFRVKDGADYHNIRIGARTIGNYYQGGSPRFTLGDSVHGISGHDALMFMRSDGYNKVGIGHTADNELGFYTSATGTNVERMRIDASGNVGIGTDNPTHMLEVNGKVKFNDPAYTNGWITYEAVADNAPRINLQTGYISRSSSGGVNIGDSVGAGPKLTVAGDLRILGQNHRLIMGNGANRASIATNYNSSDAVLDIENLGSNHDISLRVHGSMAVGTGYTATTAPDQGAIIEGNVGIGTITPSSGTGGQLKLDVEGNVGATNYCDEDGNNCFTAVDIASGATGLWTASAGDSIYFNSGTPKVGIGTDSPAQTLSVDGTFSVTGTASFAAGANIHHSGYPALSAPAYMYFKNGGSIMGGFGNNILAARYGLGLGDVVTPTSYIKPISSGVMGVYQSDSTTLGTILAGNVGINTLSPTSGLKLDVEGNVGATNYCDEDGNNCFTAVDIASGASGLWTASAGDSIYYNSGTARVGIGTDDPQSPLHILSSENEKALRIENTMSPIENYLEIFAGRTGAYQSHILFSKNGSNSFLIDNSGNFGAFNHVRLYAANKSFGTVQHGFNYYMPYDSSGSGVLSSNANIKFSIAGSEHMRLDENGNVGIGTDSPLGALHVDTSDGNYMLVQTDVSTGFNGGILMSNAPTTGSARNSFKMTSSYNGTAADPRARFGFIDNDDTETFLNGAAALEFQYDGDVILAQNTGNVGIGTDSPSAKLDVVGNVNTSGNITINKSTPMFSLENTSGSTRNYDFLVNTSAQLQLRDRGKNETLIQIIPKGNPDADDIILSLDSESATGIGTTSPSSGTGGQLKLDVEGNVGATNYCDEDGNNCFTAASVSGGSSLWTASAGTDSIYYNSGTARVGIGTDDPTAALDVVGNAYIGHASDQNFSYFDPNGQLTIKTSASSEVFKVVNGSAGTAGLRVAPASGRLKLSGNIGGDNDAMTLHPGVADSATAVAYKFNTQNSLADAASKLLSVQNAGSEKLTILGSGNVGIGNDTPEALLDIRGNYASTLSGLSNVAGIKLRNTAFNESVIGASFIEHSAGGNLFIGATRDDGIGGDINFLTDDSSGLTTKVTIDHDGMVGIGTTSPQAELHVFKSQTSSTDLMIQNNSTGSAGSGVGLILQLNPINVAGGYFKANHSKPTRLGAVNQSLVFEITNNEMMRINTAGNVGIGTTTPSSGTGGQLALDVEGNVGATNYCDEDGNNCFTAADVAGGSSLWTASSGTDSIYYNSGTPKVGIGTDTVGGNATLHVKGVGRSILIDSSNATQSVKLANTATGIATYDGMDISVNSTVSAGLNAYGIPLTFKTSATSGVGTTERMRITPDGKVGIGTDSPGFDLTVQTSASTPLNLIRTSNANVAIKVENTDGSVFFGLDAFENFNIATNASMTANSLFSVNSVTGDVGIGTINPSSGTGGQLKLDVEGPVGATNYCDEDGNNCFTAASVSGGSSLWTASAGDAIYFNSGTPLVGIGTDAPNKSLTISAGVENQTLGFDDGGMYFSRTVNGSYLGSIKRGGFSNASAISIDYDANSANSHVFKMNGTIIATIGTAAYNTDASGFLNVHNISQVANINGRSNSPLKLHSDDASGGTNGIILSRSSRSASGNNAIAVFQHDGTERMRVTTEGNVGIGTDSPSDTLNVVGTSKFVPASDASDIFTIARADGTTELVKFSTNTFGDTAFIISPSANGTALQLQPGGTGARSLEINDYLGNTVGYFGHIGQFITNSSATVNDGVIAQKSLGVPLTIKNTHITDEVTLSRGLDYNDNIIWSLSRVNSTGDGARMALNSASVSTGGEQDLVLDVEGPVGAANYCDEDGDNCFTAADVAGGSSLWTASSGTDSIYFNSGTPKVGIGTDSPASMLQVGEAGSGTISVPGSATFSEQFGKSADASGNYSLAVGWNTEASAQNAIALGHATVSGHTASIVLGRMAQSTSQHQLIIGSANIEIKDAYIGGGVAEATPNDITINATGGSGTNIAGADITLAGGKGTGNADGGSIVFSTSDAGASGTTLQTLSEKMRITPDGNVGIGTATPDSILDVGHKEGVWSSSAVATLHAPGTTNTENPVLQLGQVSQNYGRYLFKVKTTSAYAANYLTLEQVIGSGPHAGTYANTMTWKHGNVGIGINAPSSALHVDGDIRYSGILIDTSDRRLKTDITPLGDHGSVLDKLNQIDGYSFRMMGDPKRTVEYGVMAQDVEKVFPELVQTADDAMGTKTMNATGLIAPTIEAVKELKAQNDTLRMQVAERDDRLAMIETRITAMQGDVNALKVHTGLGIKQAGIGALFIFMLGGLCGIIFIRRRDYGV